MDGGDQKLTENQPVSGWQYTSGDNRAERSSSPGTGNEAARPATKADVEWTASEFVAHQKGVGWYALFGMGGFVIAGGIFFITHDIFSTIVVVLLAGILGFATSRKPRVMTYRLDRSGLTIGQKFHPYGEFKSFVLMQEGAFTSITFWPLKRFMPPVSIYFSPEDESKIVDALSSHLPMQPAGGEAFDSLMRRIRF